jgi:fumarate reductase subunit C
VTGAGGRPVSGAAGTGPVRRGERYTRHHPRWHRERMPIFWWLRGRPYVFFIARELTSLAVGYAALLLLVEVWLLGRGPEAHGALRGVLELPGVVVFHGLVLAAAAFHAITWIGLAPRALVLRFGQRRVPPGLVLGAHYAAWAVTSMAVLWILAGG